MPDAAISSLTTVPGDSACQDEENENKEVNDYIKGTMEQLLAVNNLALENKPEDLVVTTHVCRGNYHSTFFSSGAYDPIAETLFLP